MNEDIIKMVCVTIMVLAALTVIGVLGFRIIESNEFIRWKEVQCGNDMEVN